MKLLLDTHAFIWMLQNSAKLSLRAEQAINDPANLIQVSYVSLWEMTIKVSLGKLTLHAPLASTLKHFETMVPELILQPSLTSLEVLFGLPQHHRDPFDRMIVAQAIAGGHTIVSSDEALDAYAAPRLW